MLLFMNSLYLCMNNKLKILNQLSLFTKKIGRKLYSLN